MFILSFFKICSKNVRQELQENVGEKDYEPNEPLQNVDSNSYDDLDPGAPKTVTPLRPKRPPEAHLPDSTTRGERRSYTAALSFLNLFFSQSLVVKLCLQT